MAPCRCSSGLLTPAQQTEMDKEIDSVSQSASKGGKKGGAKKSSAQVDAFENEEALSQAIASYAALTPDEKTAMLLDVKRAAHSLALTPGQQKKIDADIAQLAKH